MRQLFIYGTWVAHGVYVVPMGASGDTEQADYFKQLLDLRKSEVCELLEAELDALERVQRAGCPVGVRRHRRMVNALEAELRTVDRLLLALRVRLGMPTLRRTS